jgi:hypothetical protein
MSSFAIETIPHRDFHKTPGGGVQTIHDTPALKGAELAVQLLDGASGKLKYTPIHSVNLDLHQGYAHSTTGIPYAIEGTATVIANTICAGLLEVQDPIKAIFSTQVHQKHRIIVTRKFVVGGGAQITPERAPARTVAIQEDSREIETDRYGGDIEMNLNLFLIPEAAEEELRLKVQAQKLQLENKLIELGYDAIMAGATDIVNAIMRSNPAYSQMDFSDGNGSKISDQAGFNVRIAADRIYATQIFGALQKNEYAIPNLLASVKYANAYTLGTVANPVIVLPHGVHNILKYARPESMRYDVSGVPTKDGKGLSMPLDRAFVDAVTGANILIHYPRPTYESGSINPRVGAGGLSGTCKVVTYYKPKQDHMSAVDFVTGGRLNTDSDGVTLQRDATYIRVIECAMASAIVAAPGGVAGMLLVGFPMTGVSTSQATETVRIQLRTRMGAGVLDPESIFVLPNVTFEGIIKDSGLMKIEHNGDAHDLKGCFHHELLDLVKLTDFIVNDQVRFTTGSMATAKRMFKDLGAMTVGHHGTMYGKQGAAVANKGHFGLLDSTDNYGRVWGQQVYSDRPEPIKIAPECCDSGPVASQFMPTSPAQADQGDSGDEDEEDEEEEDGDNRDGREDSSSHHLLAPGSSSRSLGARLDGYSGGTGDFSSNA